MTFSTYSIPLGTHMLLPPTAATKLITAGKPRSKAGRKTRGSVARLTRLVSGSARLDSLENISELS